MRRYAVMCRCRVCRDIEGPEGREVALYLFRWMANRRARRMGQDYYVKEVDGGE